MRDNVIPFAPPPKRRKEESIPGGKYRVTGFAIALQARPGAVSIVTDDVELGLTPAEARELARDLLELADDADGGNCG